jgi:hypothetical protein
MAPAELAVSGGTELTITAEALLAALLAVGSAIAGYKALQAKVRTLIEGTKGAALERHQASEERAAMRAAAEAHNLTTDALARSGEAAGLAIVELEKRTRKIEIHLARLRGREDRPGRHRTKAPGEDTLG